MARIAGVNIPTNKPVAISLRYIFGIGPVNAVEICEKTKIDQTKRVNELSDAEVLAIREVIDRDYVVDALSSLQVRYQLAFTDEDTSEMELRDYLAFAQELGLAEQGATFEELAPLLVRQPNGGFGDVKAAYLCRLARSRKSQRHVFAQ